MKEQEEGRPQGKLTTENNTNQREEGESWHDRQHKALVKKLHFLVEEQEKIFGEFLTREEIIRMRLNFEEEAGGFKEDPTNKRKKAFFAPLRRAWDVLAYDRYEPGSLEEHQAGELLSCYYQYYREPTIKLSDPLQVRVIDALAEVVGLPHKQGQAEIAIPEKLRNYEKWTMSAEYQEKMAKATAERKRKGEERYARLCSEPLKPQK